MPPFGEGGTLGFWGVHLWFSGGFSVVAFCVSAVVWGWLVFGWGEC